MKICVYGAGAVGGHFAVRLALAGHDVTVIARGPHLDAIRANGLTLVRPSETLRAEVTATDNPNEAGPQDLVIVTLKAPALPKVVDGVKALLGPETPVIPAQNGIPFWYFHGLDPAGSERRLDALDPGGRWWDEIGVERIIGGIVWSANAVPEPGVIQNNSDGRNHLRIGEPDGRITPRLEAVQQALASAGLDHPLSTDIRNEIWAKLIGNIAFGPGCCLTGATVIELKTDPDMRAFCLALMREAEAVAAALGTTLDTTPEDRMTIAPGSKPHKVSMLQDLEAGRPMEIDAIVSVPQQLARMTDTPTPTLDIALGLLKQRARLAGLY